MAITKILPVRGQLKGCLDYAANPQKTEYFSTADMQRLIGYTQNKDKTEHQLYVSGFNCMPQNAYCIMQATKQRWGKPLNGGNVGYHIIQSFKPGEATPDQVHEIGCEFARRFLADRFECTVSTHLDKGHLHNHIVVNSVSFMDGRMFRNDFTTYYKGIRAISDELCRENRLSVVETDGHGKSYGEWKHEKEGTPTLRGMVKADLEMAMASADSFAGFIAELQQMGYKVKYGPKVTHMAVRHKDAQRNIRLDKISPRFSEDALRSYFQELRKLPPAMQQEYKQQTVPHDQRLIHRVHPFYGKLHRPAAVEDAGRRVDMQDALGGDGNRGKTLKLRGSGKNIEVGHKTSSTRYCIENFIFLQKQRLHSDFYSALSRVFHCKPFCQ